jgi:putative alpha-1,2-mannosidase
LRHGLKSFGLPGLFGRARVTNTAIDAPPAGRKFVIETKNNSKQNVYIQSATFNGKPFDKPWIYHADVVKGGRLELMMGPSPNKIWGATPDAVPPQ